MNVFIRKGAPQTRRIMQGSIPSAKKYRRDGGNPELLRKLLLFQDRFRVAVRLQCMSERFHIQTCRGGDLQEDFHLSDVPALLEESAENRPMHRIE